MGKALKFAVVLFAVAAIMGAVPVYSQEKTAQLLPASLSAEVVSVNLEKSTVDIKTIKDAVTNTYESQTISVLPETKILRGDAALKLSDLKAGDKVVVKYTTDALGIKKVESISAETAVVAPVVK